MSEVPPVNRRPHGRHTGVMARLRPPLFPRPLPRLRLRLPGKTVSPKRLPGKTEGRTQASQRRHAGETDTETDTETQRRRGAMRKRRRGCLTPWLNPLTP